MDKLLDVRGLVVNPQNPRTITDFMQDKLTQSILLSPWMHDVHPICIDSDSVIWSGNARCVSFRNIMTMDADTIEDFLAQQTIFRDMSQEQQEQLISHWIEWQSNPLVPCRTLDDWTEEDKKELLVKDNLHAGEDDPEILRKHFNRDLISDFFGTVSWDLYDYSDKINDQGLEQNKNTLKKFKCGYVEFYITDNEFDMLSREAEKYREEHDGSLDGFLMHILDPDGSVVAARAAAQAEAGAVKAAEAEKKASKKSKKIKQDENDQEN
ncbi:hypothetical protein BFS16_00610 [Hoylesella timonensis]|uniref:ParB/Sulfiredoxin domain-containing protein n=1 Tax=Hoylesella timonensis TaxID=386414 RepID=A0A2K0XPF9_9BACT|nr:hypothetical protein [Hoylesella timonensis]PNP96420.1 hypothetical protein BFS16_00610 [Hoylesella timonensis]